MEVNDPSAEARGLWSKTASLSLSSLSIQWLRRPDADAPLARSGHQRMPPQFAALPLVVNRPFGVWAAATSRTSLATIGERGLRPKPGAQRHQPRKGVSLMGDRKDQHGRLCSRPAALAADALLRKAGTTLACAPSRGGAS